MKKKTLFTILQLLLFTLLSVGIVWYMFSKMGAEGRRLMYVSIRSTNLLLLIPVFFASLLSQWARARRWQLLLEPLDICPTTANTLFAVLIGYLVNMIPPRAGEVAKCTVLARYENMPADKMVGTILAERLWDIICLLIVVGCGVALKGSMLWAFIHDHVKDHFSLPKLFAWSATIGLLVGLLIGIYRRNRESKLGRFLRGLGNGISSITHLRHRKLFLLYTCLLWAMYILQLQLGFWAMPGTRHLGPDAALVTLIAGSFAIIASPGGIGLYPLFVSALLQSFYQISPADANAFGWVSWLSLTAIIVLSGIASLFLLPFYNRKPHDAQQAGLDHAAHIQS